MAYTCTDHALLHTDNQRVSLSVSSGFRLRRSARPPRKGSNAGPEAQMALDINAFLCFGKRSSQVTSHSGTVAYLQQEESGRYEPDCKANTS